MPDDIATSLAGADEVSPPFSPEDSSAQSGAELDQQATEVDEQDPVTKLMAKVEELERRLSREDRQEASYKGRFNKAQATVETLQSQLAELKNRVESQEVAAQRQSQQSVEQGLAAWANNRYRELTDPNHDDYVGEAAARKVVQAERAAILAGLQSQADKREKEQLRAIADAAKYDEERIRFADRVAARDTRKAKSAGFEIQVTGAELLAEFKKRNDGKVPTSGAEIEEIADDLFDERLKAAEKTGRRTALRERAADASGPDSFETGGSASLSDDQIEALFASGARPDLFEAYSKLRERRAVR